MCKGTITQKICLMHASNRIESQPEIYRKASLFRVFKTRFRWELYAQKGVYWVGPPRP